MDVGAKGKRFIQVPRAVRRVDFCLKDHSPFCSDLWSHRDGRAFFYPIIFLAFGALGPSLIHFLAVGSLRPCPFIFLAFAMHRVRISPTPPIMLVDGGDSPMYPVYRNRTTTSSVEINAAFFSHHTFPNP